jgi:hypothetical protein
VTRAESQAANALAQLTGDLIAEASSWQLTNARRLLALAGVPLDCICPTGRDEPRPEGDGAVEVVEGYDCPADGFIRADKALVDELVAVARAAVAGADEVLLRKVVRTVCDHLVNTRTGLDPEPPLPPITAWP